jgi:tRNA (cmo5U34)-methyltransferase
MHMKSKSVFFKISRTWSFNDKVSKVFDQHVNQSIPLYKEFHKQIAKISEFYCKDDSTIYDLGCSTGKFIMEISKVKKQNLNIIGIDDSKKMIHLCKLKTKKIKKNKITLLCGDMFNLKFKKADLIVCCLVLPFFIRAKQIKLIDKIYKSLNSGGVAIFLNKSISKHAQFENIFNQLYSDFKLSKGILARDVLNKTQSLRSAHTINTTEDDLKLFKKIGFKKIDIFFKYLNFTGFLVEK